MTYRLLPPRPNAGKRGPVRSPLALAVEEALRSPNPPSQVELAELHGVTKQRISAIAKRLKRRAENGAPIYEEVSS
jgi:hypothetical protein